MKKSISPNCDVCGVIDDVQHILIECTKYKCERDLLLREFKLNYNNDGMAQSILSNPGALMARKFYELFATFPR